MKALALLLFLTPSCSPGQDDLGRLFHTPEERQAIDRERRQANTPWTSFDGEVRRADKARYRWFNGIEQAADGPPPPGAVGDRYAPGGKARRPLLDNGQIIRHRPSP